MIGTILADMRRRAGLSQGDVSKRLRANGATRTSVPDISAAENDSPHRPTSVPLIVSLCDLYGEPDEAARLCAMLGKVHPVTAKALQDPDFATKVYHLAKEQTQ